MFPLPDVLPVAPPAAVLVKAAVANAGGKASDTDTPAAVLGPALDTTMVYVTVPPAVTLLTPLAIDTDTSDTGVRTSVSVATSSAALLSVIPAVFTPAVETRVPVADGSTVPVTVYVTDPLPAIVRFSLMLPVPNALPAEP